MTTTELPIFHDNGYKVMIGWRVGQSPEESTTRSGLLVPVGTKDGNDALALVDVLTGQRFWAASRRREELAQWWKASVASGKPVLLVVADDPHETKASSAKPFAPFHSRARSVFSLRDAGFAGGRPANRGGISIMALLMSTGTGLRSLA